MKQYKTQSKDQAQQEFQEFHCDKQSQIIEDQSISQVDSNSDSQIKQKTAFQFDIEQSDLEDDQIQAFKYLQNVRNQKIQIVTKINSNIKKNQSKQKQPNKVFLQQKTNLIIEQNKSFTVDEANLQTFLVKFSQLVLQNFKILEENIKYLIKTSPNYKQNNRRSNKKLFQQLIKFQIICQVQPKINDLMTLTLGQIEQLIEKICQQFSKYIKKLMKNKSIQVNKQIKQEIIIDGQSNHQKISNILLWIYSLLALHQGWSFYKQFQTLASLNMVILQISEISSKQAIFTYYHRKSLFTVIILLDTIFQQKHLNKSLLNAARSVYYENHS